MQFSFAENIRERPYLSMIFQMFCCSIFKYKFNQFSRYRWKGLDANIDLFNKMKPKILLMPGVGKNDIKRGNVSTNDKQ